jgi:hypothetical protein
MTGYKGKIGVLIVAIDNHMLVQLKRNPACPV